ncbi:efflux RND transporter periplasmic adaptor subunit [Candidatus Parcubacteria bacterium]|nr:efflux RND transporter periplasmic adaptor subunit [Candidatus Parcubacteria bacterium]
MQKTSTILKKIKAAPIYIWTNKKKKRVWIPAILIIIALLISLFGGNKSTDVSTYKVEAKEFVQNVSLTGKVIAAKNVDMGFESAGRINKVNFKVGDRVKKGQVIASLQNGDAVSNLQKSYALASAQNARLQDTQNGSRPEEIAVVQGDLVGAQNELDLSKQVLEAELQNIYNKADEAIRFKIDNVFTNPRSVNPQFNYSVDQSQNSKQKLSDDRLKLTETFVKWNGKYNISNIEEVKTYIVQVQNFINDINTAMSIAAEKSVSSDANYATVQSNKADVSLARTNFSAANNSFNQAQISYKNSQNLLTRAQNNLKLKMSGGTATQVDIQRADLQSANASVNSARAIIAKTLITAPFDGVITKVDVKEGEISSPNTPVISLLNDGEYQIETYVSENDIAKLKVDQKTKISLDAYGRDVFFEGMIITIDPAETIKDGVSTYRTKIQFIQKDERVKSGMTANIDIETDRRANIISIPQAAVILEKGIKKVYVLSDDSCVANKSCADNFKKMKNINTVEIKTGEINNTGDIEIISGLENNQTIIYGKK